MSSALSKIQNRVLKWKKEVSQSTTKQVSSVWGVKKIVSSPAVNPLRQKEMQNIFHWATKGQNTPRSMLSFVTNITTNPPSPLGLNCFYVITTIKFHCLFLLYFLLFPFESRERRPSPAMNSSAYISISLSIMLTAFISTNWQLFTVLVKHTPVIIIIFSFGYFPNLFN